MRRKDRRDFDRIMRRHDRRECNNFILSVIMWLYIILTIAVTVYGFLIGHWYYFLAMALPILYAGSLIGGFGIKDLLWVMFLGDGDNGGK